ncbi:MAG: hypothetical protein K2N34_01860 [Lachnospiraceae bacterium]|nr:hypothetical protein [Lachnospiraceae bacterium]
MNKTLLFLLFDIVLSLFIGCTNKQIDNELQQKNNPFDTDNKALLFNHIETVVDSTIRTSNIEYVENSLYEYFAWDSVTHVLFSPNLYGLKTDSELAKHRNTLTEYLNWHLRQRINTLITNNEIANALKFESALSDSLLNIQYKWLQSHFDATQDYIGSASSLKYYNIEYEMLQLQNLNLRELLQAFTDSAYKNNDYPIISEDLLQAQYWHILSDRIPYYDNDSVYNAEIDLNNFRLEIDSWNRLIKHRNQIAGLLNGKVKDAYNIGTYRLMFNRLRQLKNEFETYPIMTIDKQALTLPDNCTYDELIAYPNFTTKWNEYLKQSE